MEPELEDQVTPKSTNSSQPSKKASGAAKAKQQVSQQQHPKKAFQKMNGTSKGPNSELSTLPSVPKAQESSQPDGKADVIRKPKVAGKLKQWRPKAKHAKKPFPKQKAPPMGMDSETAAVPIPSEICKAPSLKDCGQSPGKTKKKVRPAKRAASLKENGTPKGPSALTESPHSSTRPPPAKRRKSVTKEGSQPRLT